MYDNSCYYVSQTRNVNTPKLLGAHRACKQEWDGRTHISAQGYYDILQHFGFNFYLKVFSGVHLQTKMLFIGMQTKSNDISYHSKKVEEFPNF